MKAKNSNAILHFIARVQNRPARLITLSFLIVILAGTILLALPAASATGMSHGLLKALFTATSATCVTGLVLMDTATAWTLFGQLVILSLIQIGGLGIITITTFFFTLTRRRVGLQTMYVVQESTSSFSLTEVKGLLKKIIGVTFTIEAIGAVILSARFIPYFGLAGGIYRGFFHGISSFCNAGFDMMGSYSGPYSSLMAWNSDPVVLLTTALLVIAGGLGFIVWADILNLNKIKGLNFHTRLVLVVTAFLVFGGMLFFLTAEYDNRTPDSLGTLSPFQQIVGSFFQSVTTRTAGFNSISQGNLTESSKIMSSILMFIGASPGSTGGGIKTTTFSAILFFIIAEIRSSDEIVMRKHRIPRETASKAVIIAILALALVTVDTMLISVFEQKALLQKAFNSLDILFESCSAFGTVGLSAIGTSTLHPSSWIVLMISMFIGRVGPISFALAFAGRQRAGKEKVYPEGRICVG